jgi:DNA-binding Lrp family transcriptional regulator
LGSDSELAILRVLEAQGSLSLPEISKLVNISELECSSELSHLVEQGYVFRLEDKFTIAFFGKLRLRESKG